MLVLGIDSSAAAVSAAVIENGKLLAEDFLNIKQTHSQTLLPMVQALFRSLGKECADFDLMAVSHGPGSFTGVRIGVSCVKGLAFPQNTPCVGISTLEAIAYGGVGFEGQILCAVMDARCGQVYNALFRPENGALTRLTEDRAISVEALSQECEKYGNSLVLFGDGAQLCHKAFSPWGARLAPESLMLQRASSVAFLAEKLGESGHAVTPAELVPAYLRLPQAERELKNRLEREGRVMK